MTSRPALPGPIFIDSALRSEVAEAARHGFVAGVTTNPKLLSADGRAPEVVVRDLLSSFPAGPVYHQVQAGVLDGAYQEAEAMVALAPDRVVLKLPATLEHFQLAASLTAQRMVVAMTAVYTASQYVLAAAAGARIVIPYVDRYSRLLPDERPIVEQLREVRDALGEGPDILAASVKSTEQAVAALVAGADGVSVPFEVLGPLATHPLTQSAVEEFEEYVWS